MSQRSRIEITSAEDKSIGFDYQYYYFLNELLNLRKGQSVGFEVLDDVHIDRADGTHLLVQLKHTVQKNAQGSPVNLTSLDTDLWKSISNWCKVITDPAEGRTTVQSQLAFIEVSSFLLATNKSNNSANTFLSSFSEFKDGRKGHADLCGAIAALKSESKNESIQGWIDDALRLDSDVSKKFFENLSFALGCDEIIDICKTSISEKQIDASRIDDVFNAVDSRVREDLFCTVKAGRKIRVSFDEFNRNYRRHFDKVRSEGLVIRDFRPAMPENLLDQTFIKQLLDIGDISEDKTNFIAKFTTRCLQFRDNLEQWLQDGDITQSDIDDLEQEAEVLWESQFLAAYPDPGTIADEAASARMIVKELRQKRLPLASVDLPVKMSNGGFYDLSDRPVIGWLRNWEDRYK
jgi:hypothetical protein